MKEKLIAIYGASGFGREIAWLAESCNVQVACFIDDDEAKYETILNDLPVLALGDAGWDFPKDGIIAAMGNPKIREHIIGKCAEAGFHFASLVHPRVEMSKWIEIGEGVVICAGCILTTNIRLGEHVQINLDCTIGHDVVMGDYTTLAPGVHVSGWVHLGKRVYVGTGAVIINGTEEEPLTVGDDAVIGAGACVTRSIPKAETWGGGTGTTVAPSQGGLGRFDDWKFPEIEEGKPTKYNWVVQHKDNLRLGYRTDIGAFTYVNAKYGVIIEDEVQIGSHCSIYSVSTIDGKVGEVMLKKNCKIGTHSTIMPGVTVGENALVGAHSFVNKDVPDGVTVVGVPASVVKTTGPAEKRQDVENP